MHLFKILCVTILLSIKTTACVTAELENDPSSESMDRIRRDFYLAIEDGDAIEKLIDFIENAYKTDTDKYPAVILAYYGALETLKAKHSYNPYNKFRYVIKGLKKLNLAVDKSPMKLEVRFLRFAVLHNIPGVFGISNERDQDLNVIYGLLLKKDYVSIDRKLQKGIAEFLIESGRLDNLQADKLKHIFPESYVN